MQQLWHILPIILAAAYIYLNWTPTHQLVSEFAMSQNSNENDQNRADLKHLDPQRNYIYSPLENGLYIPDNQLPLSPFVPFAPESSIAVVGGGLAGLSAAIEAVDQYYDRFEAVLKFFASNFNSKDYRDMLTELEAFPVEDLHAMLQSDSEVFAFVSHLANFKVFILEKEEKIGGNSMKASSGINAVGTPNQKNWFRWTSKTNPDDDKKHPDLYTDNGDSFVFDTLKSSISPEPPIWDPLTATSHKTFTTPELLNPLSPFTPDLIKQVIGTSSNTIPFLEKHQLFEFVARLVRILTNKYYPTKFPHANPAGQSKRHINEPPKHFDLFLTKLTQLGGHKHPRTHRPGPEAVGEAMKGPELPIGAASITALSRRVAEWPYNMHISIISSAQLIALTHPSRASVEKKGLVAKEGDNFGKGSHIVNGLVYKVLPSYNNIHNLQQHNLETDIGQLFTLPVGHVILATGGYSAGKDVLSKYAPSIANMDLPTTNGAWATGDAIDIGLAAGGTVVGMDMVQVHPTSFVFPKDPHAKVNFLAPEALRGVGGILINLDGKRFVNELTTRDVAARAIYWQPHKMSYLVLPAQCATEFGPAINFYAAKGIFAKTTLFGNGEGSATVNEIAIGKKIGEVLGETDFDKSTLVTFVNTIISTTPTNPTIDASPKAVVFGVETKAVAYQIIDLGLTMLQLTTTLKSPQNPTPSDLTALIGNVYPELIRYSLYRDQKDDVFGRPFIAKPESFGFNTDQFYISLITPAIHFTMGGLAIDMHGRVVESNAFNAKKEQWGRAVVDDVDQKDQTGGKTAQLITTFTEQPRAFGSDVTVIKGLYSAGEASGGLHGRNRLGGNSLLECVAMGRQVARTIVNQEMLPDL